MGLVDGKFYLDATGPTQRKGIRQSPDEPHRYLDGYLPMTPLRKFWCIGLYTKKDSGYSNHPGNLVNHPHTVLLPHQDNDHPNLNRVRTAVDRAEQSLGLVLFQRDGSDGHGRPLSDLKQVLLSYQFGPSQTGWDGFTFRKLKDEMRSRPV